MKLYIVVFLFYYVTSFSQNTNSLEELYPNEDILIEYHDEWGKKNYQKLIDEFKKNPLKKGDIVFLGNSITQGGNNWNLRLNHSNIKNRGIGGDVTDGVLARLDEIIFFKPKAVFLLIGINDLWNVSPNVPELEYIGNNIIEIAKLIKQKSSETKVYVQTILPIEKKIFKEPIKIVNSMIKRNQDTNVFEIIDLYSVFVNEQGLIKNDLSTDGVHLNEAGYQVWVNYIKPIFDTL